MWRGYEVEWGGYVEPVTRGTRKEAGGASSSSERSRGRNNTFQQPSEWATARVAGELLELFPRLY